MSAIKWAHRSLAYDSGVEGALCPRVDSTCVVGGSVATPQCWAGCGKEVVSGGSKRVTGKEISWGYRSGREF